MGSKFSGLRTHSILFHSHLEMILRSSETWFPHSLTQEEIRLSSFTVWVVEVIQPARCSPEVTYGLRAVFQYVTEMVTALPYIKLAMVRFMLRFPMK